MIAPLAFALALANPLTLQHDDGRSAGPNDYSALQKGLAVKELVRFEAPRRMKVTRVSVFLEGLPGKLELHFWKDIDSSVRPYIPFRHFEFDRIAPLHSIASRGDLGKWTRFDLGKKSFVLEKGQRIFVGRFVATGPHFACDKRLDNPDSSVVETFDAKARGAEQVKLLSPAGDFLVRLKGEPVAEDTSVRFEEFFRDKGQVNSIAWGDFDGDGFEDLVINGSRLIRNRGGKAFSTLKPLPGQSDFGLLFDLDNDGDLDLFRGTSNRTAPDSVWLNNGKGAFTLQVGAVPAENLHGRSVCAFDYDRDGRLDLFVADGAKLGDLVNADPSRLYRNTAQGFQAVFKNALAAGKTPPFGSSLSAGDVDSDGIPELFVGTYRLESDQIWAFKGGRPSNQAGRLRIATGATPSGSSSGGHCLGSQMADFDNDGDLDLIVANLMHPDWRGFLGCPSALFENRGKGGFVRIPLSSRGIEYEETPANPILADFDNDGRLDLFHNSMYHSANLYAWRDGRWVDRTDTSRVRASRAITAAVCDFDRDGRIDLAVADQDRGLVVFRNVSPPKRWIEFRLASRDCNRTAVGAIVRLRQGRQTLTRIVSAGRGMACQDSGTLHFGLATTEKPAAAEIVWPCGRISHHRSLLPNRIHRISEPTHSAKSPPLLQSSQGR